MISHKLHLFMLALCLGAYCSGEALGQEFLWKELNSEAVKLFQSGQYNDAIETAQESLKIAESTFGEDDFRTATSLNNLAALYKVQHRHVIAEALFKRAIKIWDQDYHLNRSKLITSYKNLAEVYAAQGKHLQADDARYQRETLKRLPPRKVARAIPAKKPTPQRQSIYKAVDAGSYDAPDKAPATREVTISAEYNVDVDDVESIDEDAVESLAAPVLREEPSPAVELAETTPEQEQVAPERVMAEPEVAAATIAIEPEKEIPAQKKSSQPFAAKPYILQQHLSAVKDRPATVFAVEKQQVVSDVEEREFVEPRVEPETAPATALTPPLEIVEIEQAEEEIEITMLPSAEKSVATEEFRPEYRPQKGEPVAASSSVSDARIVARSQNTKTPETPTPDRMIVINSNRDVTPGLSTRERGLFQRLLGSSLQGLPPQDLERMYTLHEVYRGDRERDMTRSEIKEMRRLHEKALESLGQNERRQFHQLLMKSTVSSAR